MLLSSTSRVGKLFKTSSLQKKPSNSLIKALNGSITTKQSFLRFQVRDYKLQASDLKVGDVIEHKNKLIEVTRIQHVFGAQRSATMQAEFKDVKTGNKSTERFRVSESVEVVDLDWKELTFEEKVDDDEYQFVSDDGETVRFPEEFFKGKEIWLTPDTGIQVRVLDDEPLYFRFINRIKTLQIVKTRSKADEQLSGTVTSRGKPGELSNGVTIKIPPYLETGAWVKVDVNTEEYVGKAEGPEDDEIP